MEREREGRTPRIRTRAVYRAGRLEFVEPVTPPVDGSQVTVEYEPNGDGCLAKHFGVLASGAAEEMARSIEKECERVDADEW